MNQELLSKITKLLALSESPNEHEAKSALLKAQELMVKHNLNYKDLEALRDDREEKVCEGNVDTPFSRAKWKLTLARVIADNFKCYGFGRTNYCSWIVFLGKESDVEICKTIYAYAIKNIEKNIRRIGRELNKDGYTSKGVGNDYALGFVAGLKEQFDKQKKTHEEEWGLVLVKPQDVIDEYDKINFSNQKAKYNGYSQYFGQGKKDGEKFTPNALNGSQTTRPQLS